MSEKERADKDRAATGYETEWVPAGVWAKARPKTSGSPRYVPPGVWAKVGRDNRTSDRIQPVPDHARTTTSQMRSRSRSKASR